jgi:hypothetical protein
LGSVSAFRSSGLLGECELGRLAHQMSSRAHPSHTQLHHGCFHPRRRCEGAEDPDQESHLVRPSSSLTLFSYGSYHSLGLACRSIIFCEVVAIYVRAARRVQSKASLPPLTHAPLAHVRALLPAHSNPQGVIMAIVFSAKIKAVGSDALFSTGASLGSVTSALTRLRVQSHARRARIDTVIARSPHLRVCYV